MKIMIKTIDKMELHPLCEIFPPGDERTISDMSKDIARNGLKDGIITYEDKILDGRNRYLACQMAGVEPLYIRFEDLPNAGNPYQFVISKNLHRRHLGTSQRGMLGQQVLELVNNDGTLPKMTLEQIAKHFNVGTTTIKEAGKVKAGAPESMQQEVRDGKMSLNKATDTVKRAEKATGITIKKSTSPEDKKKVQVEAERLLKEDSMLAPPTERAKKSAQEFAGKVKSGEFNGKLYHKNMAKLTKVVDTLNAAMAELLPLFCETIPQAETLEKEEELKRFVDSLDGCATSLTEQVTALRCHLASRDTAFSEHILETLRSGERSVMFGRDILPHFDSDHDVASRFLREFNLVKKDGKIQIAETA